MYLYVYIYVYVYVCVCMYEYMHSVTTMRPGFDFSMQGRWGVLETHTMR